MGSRESVNWLDIVLREGETICIRDYSRLGNVVSELQEPDHQYPKFSVFLGNRTKDIALQYLFPYNNIRRSHSTASISLRCDTGSVAAEEPVLFADADIETTPPDCLLDSAPNSRDHSVTWNATSRHEALKAVFARLVFLFADVICIFSSDFTGLESAANFLVDCAKLKSASSLPRAVRPRVIVIAGDPSCSEAENISHVIQFQEILRPSLSSLRSSFSAINTTHLYKQNASPLAQYEALRDILKAQLDHMFDTRSDHSALFSALHLDGLFKSALRHLTRSKDVRFDFVRAVREHEGAVPFTSIALFISFCFDNGPLYSRDYLLVFTLDISTPNSGSPTAVPVKSTDWSSISALDPRIVFRTLYRPGILRGLRAYNGPTIEWSDAVKVVETEFIQQFHQLPAYEGSAVELRRDQVMAASHELGRIQSNQICLFCLVRCAQHSQACHHSVCDLCAQLFGVPDSSTEYRFLMPMCFLCLSRAKMTIDVLPPTMNPSVLAIDGGGVRGVIPLEYLLLIQESLGPRCQLRELVDLSVGCSSGGLIILGLIGMGWDVSTCADVFDRLARRIFRERRRSTMSWLFGMICGKDSFLDGILSWVSWILHDSCYDAGIFDTALRETFGDDHRIFDTIQASSGYHSATKFGVIATSIAKETRSYVFGNFNVPDWFNGEHAFEVFRPPSRNGEPLVWEAARATAAAPFFFSPAYIDAIGSFQDGGLRDNFAAGITMEIARRLWPSRIGPARLISMGTGTVNYIDVSNSRSPHFRHVFRDGFLRRSYDAFMSNLDTHPNWLRMRNRLDDHVKQDYLRFDVPLRDVLCTIDNVEGMDNYRNLVMLQPGSARMAREAATALLIARFFFVLDEVPQVSNATSMLYHGTIRCKGAVQNILEALQRLQPQDMHFVTENEYLGRFIGAEDICYVCGRYYKPISVFLHCSTVFSIFLRVSRSRLWRINGFPNNMLSFVEAQRLQVAFGYANHRRPPVTHCSNCDTSEGRLQGKRKHRTTSSGQAKKRACIFVE